MTFQPTHFGLFFHAAQLQTAQLAQHSSPYAAALARLQGDLPTLPLAAAQWYGLRYRWGETAAAEQGLAALGQVRLDGATELESLMQGVALTYAVELLRDAAQQQPEWGADFGVMLHEIQQPTPASPLGRYWHTALLITAGVYLEDEALFQRGVTQFRQVFEADEIHPDGYFRFITQSKSGKTYLEQMQAVCALTLAAEAATQAGVNLWAVENRGVSVVTSAAYLVYFYFYPEKWRWEDSGTLTAETTKALFREWGAFLEIVVSRAALRGVEYLLEEQRPFYSVYGGGHTTLTHGKAPEAPKKRGWFGR